MAGSARGSGARASLAGWLAFSGLLLPYFGQTFSIFGVHNRISGQVLLLCAIMVGQWKTKACKPALFALLLVALHFVLAFAYAYPEQIRRVLELSTADTPYLETKLSGMLIMNAMPVLMGFLLSKVATRPDFRRGVVAAMVSWTFVAVVVGVLNAGYWFGRASSSMADWEELHRFSTIGMTLVLMGGFLTGLTHLLLGHRRILPLLLVLSSFLLIVVYRQRAAWIYALLATSFLLVQSSRTRSSGRLKAVFTLGFISLAGGLALELTGALTLGVVNLAQGILRGELFSSRMPLFQLAFEGFWERPLGHGLGSFASAAPAALYPHNVILEALFELGIGGAIIMTLIMGFLARNLFGLVRSAERCVPSTIIGLYLGYVMVYSMKSGSLISTEMLLSTVLLFACVPPRDASASELSRTSATRT